MASPDKTVGRGLPGDRLKRKTKRRVVITGIGAGVAKAALSDLPKGTIEHSVEGVIRRKMRRKSLRGVVTPKTIARSLRRRGLSRAIGGAGVGAATFPIFLSGVKDIKEGKTSHRRHLGMAKILGSGVVYSGGKGGVEYTLEKIQQGKKIRAAQLKKVFGKAFAARAIPGLAAAAATAGAIGYGMRRKKKGGKKRSVVPLAMGVGGLTAAAKQLPETVYYKSKGKPSMKALRKVLRNRKLWVPRVAGRGVAGAVGAGILGAILERVLDKKSKT